MADQRNRRFWRSCPVCNNDYLATNFMTRYRIRNGAVLTRSELDAAPQLWAHATKTDTHVIACAKKYAVALPGVVA